MKLLDRILDYLLDYPAITVSEAREICNTAIGKCDLDADGYLSARELISVCKSLLKHNNN